MNRNGEEIFVVDVVVLPLEEVIIWGGFGTAELQEFFHYGGQHLLRLRGIKTGDLHAVQIRREVKFWTAWIKVAEKNTPLPPQLCQGHAQLQHHILPQSKPATVLCETAVIGGEESDAEGTVPKERHDICQQFTGQDAL